MEVSIGLMSLAEWHTSAEHFADAAASFSIGLVRVVMVNEARSRSRA